MSPADTGGAPQVMPTNDWWKNLAGTVVNTAAQIAVMRAQSGIAAPAGTQSTNGPVVNPPPGTAGRNVQAKATVGGDRQPFLRDLANPGNIGLLVMAGGLALLLVVLVSVRKGRG